jgi:hypothetical protein
MSAWQRPFRSCNLTTDCNVQEHISFTNSSKTSWEVCSASIAEVEAVSRQKYLQSPRNTSRPEFCLEVHVCTWCTNAPALNTFGKEDETYKRFV